jgi:hypothetical protein
MAFDEMIPQDKAKINPMNQKKANRKSVFGAIVENLQR